MRLIDAEKLWLTTEYEDGREHKYYEQFEVEEAPTIDAEPVRHGKWIEKEVLRFTDNKAIGEWQSARCSVCGKYHTTPYMYYFSHYDYCPVCGAKMDEVNDDK